ncbi:head-tail connector protein [Enterococcus casseliflavus]|uniref:head-tail connector protein n=2 Tax=Enterococcus casseliflavus TaxID=37734 RepID=UPI003DA6485F
MTMQLTAEEVKGWLRIDGDDEDAIVSSLIEAATTYLQDATGRKVFGKQTSIAKLVCQYMITHWYEERDYYNPTPNAVRKPIITAMITQLKYGGDDNEPTQPEARVPTFGQSGESKQESGTLKKRSSGQWGRRKT